MSETTDVERAFEALSEKQRPYALLYDYYNGRQPLQYSAALLNKVFKNLDARWTENWCAVVVDSLLDRLTLSGFAIEDKAAKDALDNLWTEQDVAFDAERIHKAAIVTGEAYLVVEQDDDKVVKLFSNQPHLCHAFYSENNPKEMEFAAKWWEHEAETHLTLYYTDHLEHYTASGKRTDIAVAGNFQADIDLPEEPNPWSRIPVFHFCPDHDRILGELTNVVPLQNAINKLFADMMVSAEFGAFKQRYIISNADTAKLKNGPNELWEIPAGDKDEESTQVGSFDATELQNFIGAMDNIATKIAVITRTPKHYLLQAGDVSGEALLAMEAPLVKKAKKYSERLEVSWRSAAVFALELSGIKVDVKDVSVTWADERTVQPLMQAQSRKTNVDAGMPLVTLLRDEGWTDSELEQMAEDMDESEKRTTNIADVAIAEAKKTFDQGGGVSPYPPAPTVSAATSLPLTPAKSGGNGGTKQ